MLFLDPESKEYFASITNTTTGTSYLSPALGFRVNAEDSSWVAFGASSSDTGETRRFSVDSLTVAPTNETSYSFKLDVAKPAGGWQTANGTLRILRGGFDDPATANVNENTLAGTAWEAQIKVNGQWMNLTETNNVSELYSLVAGGTGDILKEGSGNPDYFWDDGMAKYNSIVLGADKEKKAWSVPVSCLNTILGTNMTATLEFRVKLLAPSGTSHPIKFVDLAVE